jgi:hypothetical protein
MAKDDLTVKQEAFCLAYVETGNAAEAYRRAYDVDPAKQTGGWIYVEACQLLDNPKVALRVQSLQEEAEKLSLYNVSKAFKEYEDARLLAMKDEVKNPSAAVAAIKGKVALFGLDKPKQIDLSSTDGTMTPKDNVSALDIIKERLDAIAERSAKAGEPSE